jgi:hypothetical protein
MNTGQPVAGQAGVHGMPTTGASRQKVAGNEAVVAAPYSVWHRSLDGHRPQGVKDQMVQSRKGLKDLGGAVAVKADARAMRQRPIEHKKYVMGQPVAWVARAADSIGERPAGGQAARSGDPGGHERPLGSRWREPQAEPRRPRGCRMLKAQANGVKSAALPWKPERARGKKSGTRQRICR